jgi:hypothetical protein
MRCLEAGAALAKGNNGMIDKTDIEQRAIRDARRNLAEVLTEMGLMAPFHSRTAADIDRIIEACVDGFQDSMRRRASSNEPPF